jgi:glycosyltransferase involved in cell wall biosynthesis
MIRHIAPNFPEVRFVFPGPNIPVELAGGRNVLFPGFVPDIRDVYSRPNTIVMAPLFSWTGQRVKMLEAFAMGCPVVTTRIGAMGYPVRNGEEAIFADTPLEFSDALRTLIGSMEFRRQLGERGRRMVTEKFGWNRLAEDFLSVVEEAAVSN